LPEAGKKEAYRCAGTGPVSASADAGHWGEAGTRPRDGGADVTRFFDAALGFPTVAFTLPLIVVAVYWVVVGVGLIDPDGSGDAGLDSVDDGGLVDYQAILGHSALGLDGVPVPVSVTAVTCFAWLACLSGTVLVDAVHLPSGVRLAAAVLLLPVALVAGLLGARVAVAPLRRLLAGSRPPSRADFVGRACVVRTGTVGPTFGQAEATAADGSSAVIQVRMPGVAYGASGWTALIYQYDADDDCFWIVPGDLSSPSA
jgi:hypothetical protein